MTTIYLDPVRMDATAAAIGEHAQEIQTSVSTLQSACSAEVPVSLAGWLAEELHDMAVQAQLIALIYTVAALDTALRAQQIQADQSLVAAQPALASAPVDLNTALLMGGSLVGGNSFSAGTDSGFETTMTIGGTPTYANDPLMAMAVRLQDSKPGLSAQLLGVSSGLSESRNNAITNVLAPDGLSFVGSGTYEDEFGRRGGLSATYRDPRTNDLRF